MMNPAYRIKLLILLIGVLVFIHHCTEKPSAPEYYNIFDPQSDFDDNPPVPHVVSSPDSGIVKETIFTFDASESIEGEKPDTKLYYLWDFDGDGRWDIWNSWNSEEPVQDYIFSTGGGDRSVILRVVGAKQLYSDTTIHVFVNTRPEVNLNWTYDEEDGHKIYFDASSSWDFEDGENLEFRWDFGNDGSWEISWDSNPQVENIFSERHWSVRVEARDTHHISTYRSFNDEIPFVFLAVEDFELPLDFDEYRLVNGNSYIKEGRDGWKAYAEAYWPGYDASPYWEWFQEDNYQNSTKCIRGHTTISEMGHLWLFKSIPVNQNSVIYASVQARTKKVHYGTNTGPSLFLFDGIVEFPAIDSDEIISMDDFLWGSSAWSPWYTLEVTGLATQDYITIAICVKDDWNKYSIYHEFDSMSVRYAE